MKSFWAQISIIRFIITTFFLLFALSTLAQTKRALIVGISDYESADEFNAWPNIHGTNDALLMDDCLSNHGFKDRICLLDKEATYDRMMEEFKLLEQRTMPGDTIFFHFSGHGQPFEDLNGDEGEEDGWDESIVPYDALRYYVEDGYQGEHHITDDVLFNLLSRIREKAGRRGMVYAVIDACYSGSAMRGEHDKDKSVTSIVGFCINGYKDFEPSISRKTFRLIEKVDDCAGLLAFEAALPYRRTREIKVADHYYGPLTYYVVQSLNKYTLNQNDSWIKDLFESYRNDHRLYRECFFCEATFQLNFLFE